MTTITIREELNLSKNTFDSFGAMIKDFIDNNYPNSGIQNEYEIASKMKDNT